MVSPASARCRRRRRRTGGLVQRDRQASGRRRGRSSPCRVACRRAAPVGGVAGRGRGVDDRARVDVGLGQRVGRRAGGRRARGQRRDRAGHRCRPSGRPRATAVRVTLPVLVTRNAVGDRVARVDAAVAVDVGGRPRTSSSVDRRVGRSTSPCPSSRRRRRPGRRRAAVPDAVAVLSTEPGVHVGLGQRVGRRAGRGRQPGASVVDRADRTVPTVGSSTADRGRA